MRCNTITYSAAITVCANAAYVLKHELNEEIGKRIFNQFISIMNHIKGHHILANRRIYNKAIEVCIPYNHWDDVRIIVAAMLLNQVPLLKNTVRLLNENAAIPLDINGNVLQLTVINDEDEDEVTQWLFPPELLDKYGRATQHWADVADVTMRVNNPYNMR